MVAMVRAALLAFGLLLLVTAPLRAEAVQVTYKGLKLNANLKLAAGKSVKDGVVLFLHGTLAHNKMEIVGTLQSLLAERGISSLAPTLSLGVSDRNGMYDCKVPHRHLHTDALDEIGVWVDWLKAHGAGKITLMGHSRGGNQIAWYAAERKTDAISNVVLIAPATFDAARAARDYKKRTGLAVTELLAMAKARVQAGRSKELVDTRLFIYCPNAKAEARAIVSYYAPDPRRHTPYLIPRIKAPVLVVAGSADTVVKGLIDAVRPLTEGRVTLKVIEDADHFFRDFYAEDAADAVADFLAAGS